MCGEFYTVLFIEPNGVKLYHFSPILFHKLFLIYQLFNGDYFLIKELVF